MTTMKVSQLSDDVVKGLFTAIVNNIPKTVDYLGDTTNLWYAFKYIRNYEKNVTTYVQRLFDENPNATLSLLGTIIGKEYDEIWYRLAKVYFTDYDPLTDYRRDDIYAGSDKGEVLEERNTEITTDIESSTHSAYHGFNSSSTEGVPVTDTTGDSSETKSGSKADNYTKNTTDMGHTHALQSIGYNKSPTELFTKEFQARRTQLMDIIMQDVANYLTVAVY